MKVLICLLLTVPGLLIVCNQPSSSLLHGQWRINRVELHKDKNLEKTIEADFQCWQIYPADSIVITDTPHFRKCLFVRMHRSKFNSYHPGTGAIIDEYRIDKVTGKLLQISTRQVIDSAAYTLKYFLERITDSVTGQ